MQMTIVLVMFLILPMFIFNIVTADAVMHVNQNVFNPGSASGIG